VLQCVAVRVSCGSVNSIHHTHPMCCGTLQHIAVGTVLQCMLQCVAYSIRTHLLTITKFTPTPSSCRGGSLPIGVATWAVSLCSATHCTSLQHTATHRNTLRHICTRSNRNLRTASQISMQAGNSAVAGSEKGHAKQHCNTPQHAATHCNTLQHTAQHRNTPQHTFTRCNTNLHTAIQISVQTDNGAMPGSETRADTSGRVAAPSVWG